MNQIAFEQFETIDMRIGTILTAVVFEKARKPAYQLAVDLGELGVKHSSAQITALYSPEELVGRQVVCVVNFAPRNIAGFLSEVLVLGLYNQEQQVVLLMPERHAPNGARVC